MHWRLGGHATKKLANDPKGDMYDCYFLGPPLPLGGRLYSIHEKEKEMRLAVIEPLKGKVERLVSLAKLRDPLLQDLTRRLHAAHPAYGDGILVCPTNAGAIVGVDLGSLTVAWAYIYREDKPVKDDMFLDDSPERATRFRLGDRRRFDEWKNTAPAVVDGKVVFAAPDAAEIHCLEAKQGTLSWKVDKKEGDLYLAGVFSGKVLIVGREKCRALNLADGKEVWSLVTGLPSGRGVAADNRYYLPLKSAAGSDAPEVVAIDIAKGRIFAHTRQPAIGPPESKGIPGNLLFFEGRLLSQTATNVVAYPQLAVKLKELEEKLKANPRDPAGLLERGQLFLDRGDLSKSVESLRAALANSSAAELREPIRYFLFEALSALLQKDFNAPERELREYEELTKVDEVPSAKRAAEAQRRRGIYYTVVAHGMEQIGKPVEAMRTYLEFAAHAPHDVLLPAPDDPAVRVSPEAWARGHITALLKRATPEQRKQLEEEIGKQLKEGTKGDKE
jgi:hypothetical protein